MRLLSGLSLVVAVYAFLALLPADAGAARKKANYDALMEAFKNCSKSMEALEEKAKFFRTKTIFTYQKNYRGAKAGAERAGDPGFLSEDDDPVKWKQMMDILKSKHTDSQRKCGAALKMLRIGAKRGVEF